MATSVPTRFKGSSYVTSLARQKDAAMKRARAAKASQRSTAAKTVSTLGGAAVGGAANAMMPGGVFGIPTPGVAGLLLLGLGVGMGSPAIAEAGTGSLALVVGAAAEAFVAGSAGESK